MIDASDEILKARMLELDKAIEDEEWSLAMTIFAQIILDNKEYGNNNE